MDVSPWFSGHLTLEGETIAYFRKTSPTLFRNLHHKGGAFWKYMRSRADDIEPLHSPINFGRFDGHAAFTRCRRSGIVLDSGPT